MQVQGGDESAPGVITELDENATTDPETKQQTYQGKVQVQGDLGAADGAPVTIDVVLEDRLGVLTVPIAAVKQNGDGEDVVRVIDLEHGGEIREVQGEDRSRRGLVHRDQVGPEGRRGRRRRGRPGVAG